MKVVLQNEDWKSNTSLDSRRGSPIKFLQNFPKARDDRVSNPNSQKGTGTNSPSKKPTCECVVRTIFVSDLLVRTIPLDMERVSTRLKISLI